MEMFTKKTRMEAGSKNRIKDHPKAKTSKNRNHRVMFQNRGAKTKNSWINLLKTGTAETKIITNLDRRAEAAVDPVEEEDNLTQINNLLKRYTELTFTSEVENL
jgi:hypothetical protein